LAAIQEAVDSYWNRVRALEPNVPAAAS